MRFAAAIMAGMTGMACAIIAYQQISRVERRAQPIGNFLGHRAGYKLSHLTYIGRMSAPRQSRFNGRIADSPHGCTAPGCTEPGEFRAPLRPSVRSDEPPEWQWFCLEHVRAFNARYNYFAGMSPEEIYESQRPYAGWDRETRAFSAQATLGHNPRWADFIDPLDALNAHYRTARAAPHDPRLTADEQKALAVLGLAAGADRRALRQRYAMLVRRYHPDHNGGDRRHEAQLQKVVAAYERLRKSAIFA
jgi:hypothetical protein